MQYAERAEEVKRWYAAHGHQAFPSSTNDQYLGLSDNEKETLKLDEKYHHDAIRVHYAVIEKSDAILVLNYEKYGIPGYVGGNSFLEMGFAYILRKPIFLLNPIPHIPYYETEIIAMRPTVIDGDLSRLLA